jgi:type IV pilus assembly protein PilW
MVREMACDNPLARGRELALVRSRSHSSACGASLIDVLVGLAVGLVVTIIVYQTFLALDSIRRTATATADLQSSGAFALFTLATQIGNAGAGLAAAARWLDTCPPTADIVTSLRPIDVLITDGGRADVPDSLVVRQALATTVGMPAAFASPAPAGSNFHIESPDGFAAGDRVVAISRSGVCAMSQITAIGAPSGGIVDIAHAPVAVDLPATSVLLNLGPAGRASTMRYDVVAGTLRSTDLTNGDAPAPLVPNIVNLKFQYGIDVDGDGVLDTWAGAAPPGAWAPATLLAAPRATLERIKAVRMGIVARSERPDRTLTRGYQWVLFDCASDDKASCPGRLAGTIAGSASGSYRYRTYETIVPLRNVIWNRGR